MLERDIKRIVSQYATDNGFKVFGWSSPNNRGVPDKIFISPMGHVIFVEFKQKGKFLTKLQYYIFNLLKERGCYIHVANDVLSGIDIINKYKEKI